MILFLKIKNSIGYNQTKLITSKNEEKSCFELLNISVTHFFFKLFAF